MSFALVMAFIIYHGNIEDDLINPQGNNWLWTEKITLKLLEPYLERGPVTIFDGSEDVLLLDKLIIYSLEHLSMTEKFYPGGLKPDTSYILGECPTI